MRQRTRTQSSTVSTDGGGTSLPNSAISFSAWNPSFLATFSLLLFVRLITVWLSPMISDCDETFNYWEPLHYLQFGYGLQTWEYCPSNAIRSWAYLALHGLLMEGFRAIALLPKWLLWMLMRTALAAISAACEAHLYRTVVEQMSSRIGRHLLLMLLLAPGMHISAAALLPSSFAMYCSFLVLASVIKRQTRPWTTASASELADESSMFQAVSPPLFLLAVGALVGWPFSAALGIPFALEEVFLRSIYRPKLAGSSNGDSVGASSATSSPTGDCKRLADRQQQSSVLRRISSRLAIVSYASLRSLIIVLLPLMAVDRLFYRKWTPVPWNIISYNVLRADNDSGPNVYGTEPWWFYLANLSLNFNVAFLLALMSLPLTVLLWWRSFESVVAGVNVKFLASTHGRPYQYLLMKLAPFYLWLGLFSIQPHKEERFMFVAYPALLLNAAYTLTMLSTLLGRWWHRRQRADINFSRASSDKRALPAVLLNRLILLVFVVLSVSRLLAIDIHYGGSIQVYRSLSSLKSNKQSTGGNNICLGQEWFRFPSHYLLPDGMRVRFVRTAPNGMLPRYFEEGGVDAAVDAPSIRRWLSDRPGTFREPKTRFNANNREEMDQYAANPAIECDYFVTTFSTRADGYHQNDELRALDRLAGIHLQWKRVECRPYLNARLTPALQRAFWIPQSFLMSNGSRIFSNEKSWGEYCILKRV